MVFQLVLQEGFQLLKGLNRLIREAYTSDGQEIVNVYKLIARWQKGNKFHALEKGLRKRIRDTYSWIGSSMENWIELHKDDKKTNKYIEDIVNTMEHLIYVMKDFDNMGIDQLIVWFDQAVNVTHQSGYLLQDYDYVDMSWVRQEIDKLGVDFY